MKDAYRMLLEWIGEDLDREGLKDTPDRASAALEFLTRGYKADIDEIINNAVFEEESSHMVIVKDIEVYSLCEHHLLPFFGKCHIGYIPRGRVFGVSKLARIVDMFARRLQLQERLTNRIASVIRDKINPIGVGVIIEAQHLCMMMRGVEKQNSVMKTSAMLGLFRKNEATRNEFLQLIK
jgi:GTP cyclohydrolase I